MELNDQNFEQEVKGAKLPLLVDFFAEWCSPCSVMGPILEGIAEEFEGRMILAKANLDNTPQAAQKLGIDRIPTIILFKEGKAIDGFIGLRSEPQIKEWLEERLGGKDPIDEIIKEYEDYALKNGLKLNPDRNIVRRIIKGMLENEKKYGKRYCPCRRVSGNLKEDSLKICPCSWHKEEVDKSGQCTCGLFQKG